MELPVIYVFTHDSIGVGEDGPTHQPIEQLPSLRAIPGLLVIRPCDANEVVEAWKLIMQLRHQPAVLVLTRQNLPTLDRTKYAPAAGLAQGAYILADAAGGKPDVILMAHRQRGLAVRRGRTRSSPQEGIKARVVSMPCWELFDDQEPGLSRPGPAARRQGPRLGRAGLHLRLDQVRGRRTATSIGMRTFGASAPLKDLLKEFGFTVDRVAEAARAQLKGGSAWRDRSSPGPPKAHEPWPGVSDVAVREQRYRQPKLTDS